MDPGARSGYHAAMRLLATSTLSVVAAALVTSPAAADPQGNVGLTIGAAGVAQRPQWWTETRMHLGLRGDMLFGRQRNAGAGVGPYAEAMTAFDDVQAGGGVSVLVPVHPYLPLVLSGGGYGRHTGAFGWEPGAAAELFWGSRSYNPDSWYVMAGGLQLQLRQGLGDSKERSLIIAAHLDGEVLMLPFLLVYGWVRGPSD